MRYVASLDEALLDGRQRFANTAGKLFEDSRADILVHVFNHQTHHRGQAHGILSLCGRQPPSLDLMGCNAVLSRRICRRLRYSRRPLSPTEASIAER